MNARKVARLHRELAEVDADRSRLLLALAAAFEEDEEKIDTGSRRPRGPGSMLLPPSPPVNDLDQRRAAKLLEQPSPVLPRRKGR